MRGGGPFEETTRRLRGLRSDLVDRLGRLYKGGAESGARSFYERSPTAFPASSPKSRRMVFSIRSSISS